MKILPVFFFIFFSAELSAQLTDTDIWLLDILHNGDSISLQHPVNITNRPGYDNQPSFSPDGRSLLYSSIRDGQQSDIFRLDLSSGIIKQLTQTTTSEYSPAWTPDGQHISVVMVEADSAQRLWKFSLDGTQSSRVMQRRDSIGYYCWLNKNQVALMLITSPFRLSFCDISTEKEFYSKPDSIGRSLHMSVGKKKDLFYVYKDGIYRTDLHSLKSSLVIKKKFPGEDFCFLNEKFILMADGSSLYSCNIAVPPAKRTWIRIADLTAAGIKHISRLAVSPDGKKLALVNETKSE